MYYRAINTISENREWKKSRIVGRDEVNGLWPRTVIDTAALNFLPGISGAMGRTPEILADCAHLILTTTRLTRTGNLYIMHAEVKKQPLSPARISSGS